MQTCVNCVKQLQGEEEEELGPRRCICMSAIFLSPWILAHGGLLEQQVALVPLALIGMLSFEETANNGDHDDKRPSCATSPDHGVSMHKVKSHLACPRHQGAR